MSLIDLTVNIESNECALMAGSHGAGKGVHTDGSLSGIGAAENN